MNPLKRTTYKHFTLLLIALMSLTSYRANAQSMGISSSAITPDASSILEMRTNTKGLLIPRMTTTERNAISSPATGLIVYNTSTNKFNFYDGSTWLVLFAGSTGVNSITGTTNHITIGGTSADPTIDISSSYLGQSSITTLGTIGTGTWNGTAIGIGYGGTGQTTQQGAINALTGTQTAGTYLRSNGTNASLSAIQAADVPTLNQNTTGSAATLTTSRNIYGNTFNGSADLTGIISSTYGGTGNGFTKLSGPATTEKTFTLPNANATILTDNAAVTVAQGGTGQTSYTDGQLLIGNSTGNTLTKSTLTAGSGISITNAGGSITIANSSPSSGGTVTSVAALTLGTIGTDLSSSVATGTTTPVITLNVPTASASNRGALSAADWSTFNGKESALTFSTGLTRTTNTVTVNTSQNINTLSNLTSNGLIKTSGGTGALSIATAGTDFSAGTSALATGILKSTTSTGALSIAVAGDFPTLNQNTTGSAATLTTSRNIYGNAFNGSADVTGIIASTYGGTGNGFAKLTGPATSEKTFTLPNASAAILTDNATVTAAQGGTGNASYTVGDILYASASTTLSKLADVATGNVLISGGTSSAPSYGKVGLTTHVTGTLPIANGGTNSTATPTNGGIAYGDGSAYQFSTAGAAGQVLKSNGAASPVWDHGVTIVTLGSDVINNNSTANTIADVTGLSFPVTAGVTYNFHAMIIYTSAATTTGSRWAINGPASPTLLAYTSQYSLTATTVTNNNVSAYDTPAASNASSATTTGNITLIDGVIKPSANGTVIIRFASKVANSAITAKAGSTITWW